MNLSCFKPHKRKVKGEGRKKGREVREKEEVKGEKGEEMGGGKGEERMILLSLVGVSISRVASCRLMVSSSHRFSV